MSETLNIHAVLMALTRAGLPSSRSAVYRAMESMAFPKPVAQRGRANLWNSGEVASWIARQRIGAPPAEVVIAKLVAFRDGLADVSKARRVRWMEGFIEWAGSVSQSRQAFEAIIDIAFASDELPERHRYHLRDYARSEVK